MSKIEVSGINGRTEDLKLKTLVLIKIDGKTFHLAFGHLEGSIAILVEISFIPDGNGFVGRIKLIFTEAFSRL